MLFLRLFKVKSKLFYFYFGLFSLVNSSLYSGLLYIISSTLNDSAIVFFNEYKAAIFLVLVISSFLSNSIFQSYVIRITNDIIYEEELEILQKIKNSSLPLFEKIGTERVYTAIGDTRTIGNFPEVFINTVNAFVTVCCGLIYLMITFPLGGIIILGVMAGLLWIYILRNKPIQINLNKLRDLQDKYHQYLRDFLYGFRELKVSPKRRYTIFEKYLSQNRMRAKQLDVHSAIKYLQNELTGGYSWYLVLFTTMFLFPQFFNMSTGNSVTFAIVILYMMSPMSVLIGTIPYFTKVKIAIERLADFQTFTDVHAETEKKAVTPSEDGFSNLSMRNITFEHVDAESNTKFLFGPINIDIAKSETIFITGTNGSGKSTFVNVLVGLYQPMSGVYAMNGMPADDIDALRNKFAVIFSDHYLFAENFDEFDLSKTNLDLQEYLKLLKIDQLVKHVEGKDLFDNKLSRGQRKRLALVYALLESKPIIVLDEWASEQDPLFKNYFYETILPFLKRMNKTVIAVSHDNRYYHFADRIIVFEYGRIVKDETVTSIQSQEMAQIH